MPYALIHDGVSRDLVEACEQLLAAAKEGQAIGAVFGIELRLKKYIVNVAGSLAKDPTLARGIVCAMDDDLSRMVAGRVHSSLSGKGEPI